MAVPELAPLATSADVLVALGFPATEAPDEPDLSVLPPMMQNRMPMTLRKVSRRFRKEAQRIFTPGTYTHRLMIHCGATKLMEEPNAVIGVRVFGRIETDWVTWDSDGSQWLSLNDDVVPGPIWTVDGQSLQWNDWDFWGLNGREVEVTYSWDTPVPSDVVAAVADITARNLTINPMGAERQSKLLQSRHFRQEMADWVMSGGTGFTKDDIEQAQSYAPNLPPVIIANSARFDRSPTFLSDSSW